MSDKDNTSDTRDVDPIWLSNSEFLIEIAIRERNAREHLLILLDMVAPRCLVWLNETKVLGDPSARKIARKMLSLFESFCRFDLLAKDCKPRLREVRTCAIRLRGLTK